MKGYVGGVLGRGCMAGASYWGSKTAGGRQAAKTVWAQVERQAWRADTYSICYLCNICRHPDTNMHITAYIQNYI